jgi:transposase
MSRKCSICIHKKRAAIDDLLASGLSNRRIAAQYAVSENAIRRHQKHITGQLAQAQAERATNFQAAGKTLLERLSALETEARLILEGAKADGDKITSLKALDSLRRTMEVAAKYSPIRLALPTVNDAGGTARAMAAVCEAAAQGRITTSEGAGLGGLLELYRKALETGEMEQRISALEERSYNER